MKIALVSPYDMGRHGGVQNQVALIADSLGHRGHQVCIVAPGHVDPAAGVSLGPTRVWRGNDSAVPIKLSPFLVKKLRTAVAGVDVVHVHEPLMPLVSVAAVWTNKPLVGTFHADPPSRIRGIYKSLRPLHWHMSRYHALAAVSRTAHSALASFGDIPIVPNGVATEGLPRPGRIANRLIFVGRNDRRKGLDVALDALPMVRLEHPGAELIVVTPDQVESGPAVTVLRGVNDQEKQRLLATSQIFVGPNRGGESFGLTVAEGMAAGAACVVSDLPAFRDVVGDTAILVPPNDPIELAVAISALLADQSTRRHLGSKARERANTFSIERTVDAYLPMYQSAISS